jgi:molecular chaperone DnaJ
VQTPSKLNKEQSELLKKFAQLRGEKADKVEIHTHKDEGFFGRVRNAFR